MLIYGVLADFRLSTHKDPTVRRFSTGTYYRLAGLDAILFGRNGQRFRETYCLHLHVICHEDGGIKLLRNVDKVVPDYHCHHGNCLVS